MGQLPELLTPRLCLRPFVEADAPDVERLASAREVAAGTLTVPHPYPKGAAVPWIASHAERYAAGTGAVFAIVAREGASPAGAENDAAAAGGGLRGAIGLELALDHARAELGYWIGTEYWGQGLATEAGHAVLRFGFEELGLQRIHASFFAHNPRSGRVLEKLGMTREGRLRSHYRKWEEFVDSVFMGILREEYSPSASNEAPEVTS